VSSNGRSQSIPAYPVFSYDLGFDASNILSERMHKQVQNLQLQEEVRGVCRIT
jgi:hypothetical protein